MAIGMQRRVFGHRAISVILDRQRDIHINAPGECARLGLGQTHGAIVQDPENVKAAFLVHCRIDRLLLRESSNAHLKDCRAS